MTQAEQILDHLKSGHTLTSLEALNLFGCLRLGARIYDLIRDGNDVKSELVELPNGKHVAQYKMEVKNGRI